MTAQWWQIVVCFYLIIYQNLKTKALCRMEGSAKLQVIDPTLCAVNQNVSTLTCTGSVHISLAKLLALVNVQLSFNLTNWSGSTKSLAFFWWNEQPFSWKRRIKLLLVARAVWKWRRNWYCVRVRLQTDMERQTQDDWLSFWISNEFTMHDGLRWFLVNQLWSMQRFQD